VDYLVQQLVQVLEAVTNDGVESLEQIDAVSLDLFGEIVDIGLGLVLMVEGQERKHDSLNQVLVVLLVRSYVMMELLHGIHAE